jgi:hypothetical protein
MTKKTTRTRAEAKRLMWEYYRDNRETLPTWIREFREDIISSLIVGRDIPEAFSAILDL